MIFNQSTIPHILLGHTLPRQPRHEGARAPAGPRFGALLVGRLADLGGTTNANIYDHTYALEAVKIGEPTQIVYLRDGERHETEIVLAVRE